MEKVLDVILFWILQIVTQKNIQNNSVTQKSLKNKIVVKITIVHNIVQVFIPLLLLIVIPNHQYFALMMILGGRNQLLITIFGNQVQNLVAWKLNLHVIEDLGEQNKQFMKLNAQMIIKKLISKSQINK